ncbi:Uncharacterized protein Fot_32185 [Forsythia ovata]|uniref:Uncharacterized protein n=1 Tax=Forsythia ovata TaxID=205694 RepID=A0ABD1T7J2_9LAMI
MSKIRVDENIISSKSYLTSMLTTISHLLAEKIVHVEDVPYSPIEGGIFSAPFPSVITTDTLILPIQSMDSNLRKQSNSLPPKRGRVTAQIFESLAETVTSTAGQLLVKIKGGAATSDTSASASASASSSPQSAYTSDGYPDQA